MKVAVDTTIWSLALRRRKKDLSAQERGLVHLLRDLIVADSVVLLGVVRQELLSGIRDGSTFSKLAEYLREFSDCPPTVQDYERAAGFRNRCEDGGISASAGDMLICSLAYAHGLTIFTTDSDFSRYAKVLPITLADEPSIRAVLNQLSEGE